MDSIKNKKAWILAGYTAFARSGPGGLKIEALSRAVQKSKSSFYHYFADLEIFTEQLLAYHAERAQLVSAKEAECNNVDPELLSVFVEFKEDLLFNRQLRIHREEPGYEACFQEVNAQVGVAILPIWSAFLGLPPNSPLAALVLSLTIENFFLQITEENLNMGWLQNYVHSLRQMVKQFQHSQE